MPHARLEAAGWSVAPDSSRWLFCLFLIKRQRLPESGEMSRGKGGGGHLASEMVQASVHSRVPQSDSPLIYPQASPCEEGNREKGRARRHSSLLFPFRGLPSSAASPSLHHRGIPLPRLWEIFLPLYTALQSSWLPVGPQVFPMLIRRKMVTFCLQWFPQSFQLINLSLIGIIRLLSALPVVRARLASLTV